MKETTMRFILISLSLLTSQIGNAVDYYEISKELFLRGIQYGVAGNFWLDAGKCKPTGERSKNFTKEGKWEAMEWGIEFDTPEKKEEACVFHNGLALLPSDQILFRTADQGQGSGCEDSDDMYWPALMRDQQLLLNTLKDVNPLYDTFILLPLEDDGVESYYRDIFSKFIGSGKIFIDVKPDEIQGKLSVF